MPSWNPETGNQLSRFVVAISNNEQGGLGSQKAPIPQQILVPGADHSITYGGPRVLSGYIEILRKRFKNNLVLLDSGRFIKSNSNIEDIESLRKFYAHLDYDGILFSEEEVIQFLENAKTFNPAKLPFINSNIIDLKTKKLLTRNVEMDSRLVSKGDLKIGIIGITSYDGKKIKVDDHFKGIYFEKPAVTFLEYKNKLKRKGAEIIILMANLKTSCESKMPPRTLNSPRPSWAKIYCQDSKDDLLRFLKRIPRGSLDLLVLANNEKQLRGFLIDTPVITTPPSSGFLSMVEMFYDKKQKKLVWDKSLLHPKIQLCQNFFSVTSDCSLTTEVPGYKDRLMRLKKSSLQVKPAFFLGLEVKPDLSVNSFLPILK
ncbi:MAG: hypothetical protein ACJAT2_000184 [Bacteriovoracaceae bacterium]|jgi:hypothetical protein